MICQGASRKAENADRKLVVLMQKCIISRPGNSADCDLGTKNIGNWEYFRTIAHGRYPAITPAGASSYEEEEGFVGNVP